MRGDARPEDAARSLARVPPLTPVGPDGPEVSCVLVSDAPEVTARAVGLFAAQDHEARELVLVVRTDGSGRPQPPLPAEVTDGLVIRTVTAPPDASAAEARDAGCRAATGVLLALWEPDAWYPRWRLRYQTSALLSSGQRVSAAASALVWDPLARESWAGDAAPWSSPARLFGATVCLTRQAWAARPFAERRGALTDGQGCFVIDAPDTFHVPRGAHLAVLVRPGAYQPEIAQAHYLRGTVELLLGDAAHGWGATSLSSPAAPLIPALPRPASEDPAAMPPPDAPQIPQHTDAPGQPPADAGPPPAPARVRTATGTAALLGMARPLVSCIMPTFNRRRFVAQALRNVRRQDYPRLELVVVDDGSEPVDDLLAGVPHVRYVHLGERATIGRKRDIACEMSRGEIVVQWDDDDWYGPRRVSRQVEDIVRGAADLTGIGVNLMLDVRSLQLWSTREQEAADPRYAALESLAGGTLSFPRECWHSVGGYPDASLGEDVGLVQRFADAGARIAAISNRASYVYIRHGRNSWRFDFAPEDGPAGWNRAEGPGPLSAEDLAFYASLTPAGGPARVR